MITTNAVDTKTAINPWTGDPELLAVGTAHQGKRGDVVKDAFVRDPSDPQGELRIVNQLYRWVYRHTAELLVTHDGLRDLERLTGRAEHRAEVSGVKHKVHEIRDIHVHHELPEISTQAVRHRDRDTWRKSREPLVQELGERYLETGEERIESLLYGVAASDAAALLELHEERNPDEPNDRNTPEQRTKDCPDAAI